MTIVLPMRTPSSIKIGDISMRQLAVLLVMLSLSLIGCYDAPEGTRHMNAEERAVAEVVANYFDVPEDCRHYNDIGIYQAVSQEDFYQATHLGTGGAGGCAAEAPGVCPDASGAVLRARTIHSVSPPWEDLTVLDMHINEDSGASEGVYVYTFAHEMLHVFRVCELGSLNGNGHNAQFDEIENYVVEMAFRGELPARMTFLDRTNL